MKARKPLQILQLASYVLLAMPSCATRLQTGPRLENFNGDWKFAKGAQTAAEQIAFDDASWQAVRLPHDWAIASPYDAGANPHTGKLPWQGEGWYRKRFTLPKADQGRRVYLDFDGAMAMPTVYVNGQKVGDWDYGYQSFRVDASDAVRFGESNLIAVHLDTRSHQSRWYPGAGLYRKVVLVVANPIHIAHWGTFVTTPRVERDSATVEIQTLVENHQLDSRDIELETTLYAPLTDDASPHDGASPGKEVASLRSPATLPGNGSVEIKQSLTIDAPELWDIETPRLYTALTRVLVARSPVDSLTTPFGIRTFEFTADDGFHLNGRRVQLNGVNLHHDHGPLGAAFYRRAMERQLEIMREMGVNAIRTSHNPPSPELLDLCDRMGFVVWDELFDKWDGTATLPPGCSILEHAEKQTAPFIQRDRNHPSVVVWSVGNEVWDLEGGKIPDGPALLRQMVGLVKKEDPTRPVTLAHAVSNSAETPLDDALDVGGWNYARRYAKSRELRPRLPIIYSESASAFSTRGYYEFPHPSKKTDYPLSLRISSYDHNSSEFSDLADTEFALMEQDRFVAGEFVWTGFDYLGEPVPFVAEGWHSFKPRKLKPAEESRISSFGIVDLVGIPKDRYYLYRSHWAPDKQTIHILPHWNWPDRLGQLVPVYVYTNGDTVELFLNGRSVGKRRKDATAPNVIDRYRLRFEDVVYEPGELRALAYKNGALLGEARIYTTGPATTLRLVPDRAQVTADGDDLSYILVEALDGQGRPCPLAVNDVAFTLEGPATIAGVGNGDHHFPAAFQGNRVALFYGKAMLIVRTESGKPGKIRVAAASNGLATAHVELRSR